jgi:hypothetical protein
LSAALARLVLAISAGMQHSFADKGFCDTGACSRAGRNGLGLSGW